MRYLRCNGKTRGNQAGLVKSVPARGIACAKALRQKKKKRAQVFEDVKEGLCEGKAEKRMEEEIRKEGRSQITQSYVGHGKESEF